MRNCHVGRADLKVERKMAEKYRRLHMKTPYLKLSSIIPAEHRTTSKDIMTKQDNLDQTTSYIKYLRERIEKLKQTRLVQTSTARNEMGTGYPLPIIEDLNLDILLISGANESFMFHEVMNVLEEEGAQVIHASFSVVGDNIYHTTHSHTPHIIARVTKPTNFEFDSIVCKLGEKR
ncbi:hypothetical protein C4D60_Mb09t16770 [Musa balbisiana]|uniref:BHLH domain-containing protein n=1 Tax=Musa balbisiana TaxID=52838 RepID=A0A4S8IJF5_MUSBA|nr:hypothetical protein C4D60_Mb09t16770 [Musa balbisiana]